MHLRAEFFILLILSNWCFGVLKYIITFFYLKAVMLFIFMHVVARPLNKRNQYWANDNRVRAIAGILYSITPNFIWSSLYNLDHTPLKRFSTDKAKVVGIIEALVSGNLYRMWSNVRILSKPASLMYLPILIMYMLFAYFFMLCTLPMYIVYWVVIFTTYYRTNGSFILRVDPNYMNNRDGLPPFIVMSQLVFVRPYLLTYTFMYSFVLWYQNKTNFDYKRLLSTVLIKSPVLLLRFLVGVPLYLIRDILNILRFTSKILDSWGRHIIKWYVEGKYNWGYGDGIWFREGVVRNRYKIATQWIHKSEDELFCFDDKPILSVVTPEYRYLIRKKLRKLARKRRKVRNILKSKYHMVDIDIAYRCLNRGLR